MANQKERQALIPSRVAVDYLDDTRLPRVARKPASLRHFSGLTPGHPWPGSWPGQRAPFSREPGPFLPASVVAFGLPLPALGPPLNIKQIALLIGCSPWTVRQTLIPRGLPHFRFKASGRLTFYQAQVIRWIESQQQGGKTNK
jgi:hypothetical protein